MDRNEKLLLLQLILEDIRGNWGWDVEKRATMAAQLARELELPAHIKSTESYLRGVTDGDPDDDMDGRFFRMAWEYGGYEDGDNVHGLPRTIMNRSEAFQTAADDILTYPEYCFDDWDAYQERDEEKA